MGRSHSIETMSVPHLVLNRVDWLTQRVVDYQVVCLYSHLLVCLFVHLLVCLTDYEYGHLSVCLHGFLSVCLRGLLAAYRIVQLDDYLFHPYYPPRVGSNPPKSVKPARQARNHPRYRKGAHPSNHRSRQSTDTPFLITLRHPAQHGGQRFVTPEQIQPHRMVGGCAAFGELVHGDITAPAHDGGKLTRIQSRTKDA